MKKETYKPIKGFKGYRVGSNGTIWTCRKRKRLRGFHGGTYTVFVKKWTKMKLTKTRQNRFTVCLYPGNKQKLVHRIVLESFVGNCPKGMETCHYPDRNPSNNNLCNLRWDTKKSNHQDAVIHGTKGFGDKSPRKKHIKSSHKTR